MGTREAYASIMLMRFQRKVGRGDEPAYYTSLVRAERVGGRVVQTTVRYLGRVEDQIPYLKADYPKGKPRLVWDDEDGKA